MTKLSVSKLVNARSVFESWVMLTTLNVLHAFTAVICYCNKTCSLALALNFIFFIIHVVKPSYRTATEKTRKQSHHCGTA